IRYYLVAAFTYLCSFFFFFFSSRRRHTRFSRDWSSDVCSSDLPYPFYNPRNDIEVCPMHSWVLLANQALLWTGKPEYAEEIERRSEERRVGKECRSRWWA